MTGLERIAYTGRRIFQLLERGAGAFHVRYPHDGRHVEGDLTRQVLAEIEPGGRVHCAVHDELRQALDADRDRALQVYSKTPGTNDHGMVDSSYFIRGYAIHGYAEVPTYAASHGCLRVPIPDASSIYAWVQHGHAGRRLQRERRRQRPRARQRRALSSGAGLVADGADAHAITRAPGSRARSRRRAAPASSLHAARRPFAARSLEIDADERRGELPRRLRRALCARCPRVGERLGGGSSSGRRAGRRRPLLSSPCCARGAFRLDHGEQHERGDHDQADARSEAQPGMQL